MAHAPGALRLYWTEKAPKTAIENLPDMRDI
jgi:hypothetical protein